MRNDIERKRLAKPAAPTSPMRFILTLAGLICVGLAAAGAVLPAPAPVKPATAVTAEVS